MFINKVIENILLISVYRGVSSTAAWRGTTNMGDSRSYLRSAWSRVRAAAGRCVTSRPPSVWQWRPLHSSGWRTGAHTTWTASSSGSSGSYGSPHTGQKRRSGDPAAAHTLCSRSSGSSEEECVSRTYNSICVERENTVRDTPISCVTILRGHSEELHMKSILGICDKARDPGFFP